MKITRKQLKKLIIEHVSPGDEEDEDWGGYDQFDVEAAEQAAEFDDKWGDDVGIEDELEQEKAAFLNDISKRWYDEFNIAGGTDLFDDGYAGSDVERKQKMIDKLLSDAYDELMTAMGADAARSDLRYR